MPRDGKGSTATREERIVVPRGRSFRTWLSGWFLSTCPLSSLWLRLHPARNASDTPRLPSVAALAVIQCKRKTWFILAGRPGSGNPAQPLSRPLGARSPLDPCRTVPGGSKRGDRSTRIPCQESVIGFLTPQRTGSRGACPPGVASFFPGRSPRSRYCRERRGEQKNLFTERRVPCFNAVHPGASVKGGPWFRARFL